VASTLTLAFSLRIEFQVQFSWTKFWPVEDFFLLNSIASSFGHNSKEYYKAGPIAHFFCSPQLFPS
jgi:hypothetical protein